MTTLPPETIALPDAPPDLERLTGLVFELASQLHAERARRLALEQVLVDAGVLARGWEDSFEPGGDFRERSQASLDDAMARLMRIMAESTDPRTPLRHEASAFQTAPD